MTSRPLHLRWSAVGIVVLGGSAGTFIRYLGSVLIPTWNGLPAGIFLINVTGAFALGWLLEALVRRGPDDGPRRTLRLLLGTGLLGGYTTYSTFAVDADGLLLASRFSESALYGLATVIVGAAASIAGIALGAALHRRRTGKGAR